MEVPPRSCAVGHQVLLREQAEEPAHLNRIHPEFVADLDHRPATVAALEHAPGQVHITAEHQLTPQL